jgi:hypothetical protein
VSFLRFLRTLSLGLWLGSILFFGAVVAPTAFGVLPTRNEAGMIVSGSLNGLHWLGIVCGLLFLLATAILSLKQGKGSPFAVRDVLLALMLAMTLYTQYGVERRMNSLKSEMGVIDQVAKDDPRRVEFNRLHKYSTAQEESVFVLGLVLLFLVVKADEDRASR